MVELDLELISRLISQQWHTSSSTQTELSLFCSISCFLYSFSGLNFQILLSFKVYPLLSLFKYFKLGGISILCEFTVYSLCNIPGSGRSPGERMATHFNILAWKNPMDRGACHVTVHGVTTVRHNLVIKPPPPTLYHTYLFLRKFILIKSSSREIQSKKF